MAGAFGGAKSAFGRARAGGSAFMSGLKHGWKQGTTPTPLFRKKKPAKKSDDTETEIDKLLLDGMNDEDLVITFKKKIKKHVYGLTRRSPIIEINLIEV